jgi:hypothetical protein
MVLGRPQVKLGGWSPVLLLLDLLPVIAVCSSRSALKLGVDGWKPRAKGVAGVDEGGEPVAAVGEAA